jgi:hypothetical protein
VVDVLGIRRNRVRQGNRQCWRAEEWRSVPCAGVDACHAPEASSPATRPDVNGPEFLQPLPCLCRRIACSSSPVSSSRLLNNQRIRVWISLQTASAFAWPDRALAPPSVGLVDYLLAHAGALLVPPRAAAPTKLNPQRLPFPISFPFPGFRRMFASFSSSPSPFHRPIAQSRSFPTTFVRIRSL